MFPPTTRSTARPARPASVWKQNFRINNLTNKTRTNSTSLPVHLCQGQEHARPTMGGRDHSGQPQDGAQALQEGLDPTLLLRKEKVKKRSR